jgi:hypothetical protein
MEGPLSRLHILSRSVNKHGRHMQLLFLIVPSTNQNQELPVVALFVNKSGRYELSL